MSLERASSETTLLSRAWTTTDLSKGLQHVLADDFKLPENLEELEDLEFKQNTTK